MGANFLESDQQRLAQARLERLITWLLRAVAVGLLLFVVNYLVNPAPQTLISMAIGLVALGLFLYARAQVRRGRIQLAALILSALILGIAMVTLFVLPESSPEMIMLYPVLSVGIALPYLDRQRLRWLLVAAWLFTLGSATVLQLRAQDLGKLGAGWVNGIVLIGILSGLIYFVIWQFSIRMNETVSDVRSVNTELKTTQRLLENQVAQAQRLQQEADRGRERLERAVVGYVSFVQDVGRGAVSRRMELQEEGVLGQLTVGLNLMAEDLEHSQTETQRLLKAEGEARQRLEAAVQRILRFVQLVARGDLAQRLEVDDDGALGQLGSGLNEMVESLQRITGEIQQASANLAAASSEILAVSSQQAAGAAAQSAAITQTTTTLSEVKAIAEQTAQQATRVVQDSQLALQIARQGLGVVERTIAGMGEIRGQVANIAETILTLSEQTKAIGTIIVTVNDLADQSNLLALNAAIEAARAGEQGKSFAVVAQHVRELAERSKRATAQVRNILSEIQQLTKAAVLVTEEGTKGVDAGSSLAGQAGEAIHRIVSEIESGAQANIQMAGAAQEQTNGMEQISQAIQAIQQATHQTLASTRQAERTAADLTSLTQSLQQAIAVYRV